MSLSTVDAVSGTGVNVRPEVAGASRRIDDVSAIVPFADHVIRTATVDYVIHSCVVSHRLLAFHRRHLKLMRLLLRLSQLLNYILKNKINYETYYSGRFARIS